MKVHSVISAALATIGLAGVALLQLWERKHNVQLQIGGGILVLHFVYILLLVRREFS